jgi:hypothetical protein
VNHPDPRGAAGSIRRTFAVVAAVLLGLGISALAASPAAGADSVGYVRLAHLSPDTPDVDVYLSKVGDTSFKRQKFPHVGYGIMSNYLALPLGTYAVAMRLADAPESSPPVLTTQVTVEGGAAYTVAGVGKNAGLGLKVFNDDLSRPGSGKSKVRIIQASVKAPVLDVALSDGTPIANGVEFATTTPYQLVKPGTWTLQLKPRGAGATSTVDARLGAGNVYSLLVLDESSGGLTAELRRDAGGSSAVPDGGVETGHGGAARAAGETGSSPLAMIGIGLTVLLLLVAVGLRMRRLASRRS